MESGEIISYSNPVDCNEAQSKASFNMQEGNYWTTESAETEMVIPDGFDNLRYSKKSGDLPIILNKGPKATGFMVCKDCSVLIPIWAISS